MKTIIILLCSALIFGCTIMSTEKTMSVVSERNKRVDSSCGYFSTRFLMIGRQNEAYVSNNEVELSFCSNSYETKGYLWGFVVPIMPLWDSRLNSKSTWKKEMTIRNVSLSEVQINSLILNGVELDSSTICINWRSCNSLSQEHFKEAGVNVTLKHNEYLTFKYFAGGEAVLEVVFDDGDIMQVDLESSSALTFWVLTV